MKTSLVIGICIALLAVAFVFGCTQTSTQELSSQDTAPKAPSQASPDAEDQQSAAIYACPLDGNKLSYSCTTDADCKMIGCRGGAGEVYTCVNRNVEYEGVPSSECVCKEVYSYMSIDDKGIETTTKVSECRRA